MQPPFASAQQRSRAAPHAGRSGACRLIAFGSGGVEYALPLECAREVQAWAGAHPLPSMPPHMRGIINLRGKLVPITDLRALVSNVRTDAGDEHVVVIVAINGNRFGILVDTLRGLINVGTENISPQPRFGDPSRDGLYAGLARHENRIIGILDVSRVVGSS